MPSPLERSREPWSVLEPPLFLLIYLSIYLSIYIYLPPSPDPQPPARACCAAADAAARGARAQMINVDGQPSVTFEEMKTG